MKLFICILYVHTFQPQCEKISLQFLSVLVSFIRATDSKNNCRDTKQIQIKIQVIFLSNKATSYDDLPDLNKAEGQDIHCESESGTTSAELSISQQH